MILENLCKEGEQREAIGYLKEMKEQFYEAETEIKSGNPVTDILFLFPADDFSSCPDTERLPLQRHHRLSPDTDR